MNHWAISNGAACPQANPTHIKTLFTTDIRPSANTLLIPATRFDGYRTGATWHLIDAGQHGQAVDEVNHYNGYRHKRGDVLRLQDMRGRGAGVVRLVGIRIMDTDALTEDDLQGLGYDSQEGFLRKHGRRVRGRAWLYEIAYSSDVQRMAT